MAALHAVTTSCAPPHLGKGDGGDGAGGEGERAVGAAELACDAKFLAGHVDDTGETAAVARLPERAHRRREAEVAGRLAVPGAFDEGNGRAGARPSRFGRNKLRPSQGEFAEEFAVHEEILVGEAFAAEAEREGEVFLVAGVERPVGVPAELAAPEEVASLHCAVGVESVLGILRTAGRSSSRAGSPRESRVPASRSRRRGCPLRPADC